MNVPSRWHRYICSVMLLFACANVAHAQDSMRMTVAAADKIFTEKNLYALAARLHVEEQKAYEIQARLYPNPTIGLELNAVNPSEGKVFDIGRNGQKAFNIEQLIVLGGKRKNAIALSGLQTRQASYELETLLRDLTYQLHNSLYSVYFDQVTLKKYDQQLEQLDTLIAAYETQAKKGNIALKEVVRLKSVYIKLNNDKTDLLRDIQEEQKTLQLLLQTSDHIIPDLQSAPWDKMEYLPPADSMLRLAIRYRPDLQLSDLQKQTANMNLQLQKSMAVPDVTVGGSYDQQGGAFRNQVNLTLGMPIPLFNRNQGNIKSAQILTKISEVQQQSRQAEITAEVNSAWQNMRRSVQEYQKVKQVYNSDFNDVLNGITENFRKRNVSIIEFVDFYESYNETIAEVNRIRKQLALSAEAINNIVAFKIYP